MKRVKYYPVSMNGIKRWLNKSMFLNFRRRIVCSNPCGRSEGEAYHHVGIDEYEEPKNPEISGKLENCNKFLVGI